MEVPVNTPIYGAFDQGVAPTIAFINKATIDMKVDFNALIVAMQKFVSDCFAPVWGTPATIVRADEPPEGNWIVLFVDDADAANALGYHDLTKGGMPVSKVFVRTTLQAGEKVSVTASHEVAEMLVDPAINIWAWGPDRRMYAYETADAVEGDSFEIDGIPMSDFVYPSYFEKFRGASSRKFDYMGLVTKPFEIRKNGYSIIMARGRITNIFGSAAKAREFQDEDRRQHRSEYRKAIHEGVKLPVKKAPAKKSTKNR
jgi:hypothetical protein